MALTMMSNRGVKTWPGGHPETFCTENYRCRFASSGTVTQSDIIGLLTRVAATGMEIVKTENLRNYDGAPGYTLAQGE
jgi:isocitrate dehydrogenase